MKNQQLLKCFFKFYISSNLLFFLLMFMHFCSWKAIDAAFSSIQFGAITIKLHYSQHIVNIKII